jgi:hypothetical protein
MDTTSKNKSELMDENNIVSSDTYEIKISPDYIERFNLSDYDLKLIEASVRTDVAGMTPYQCTHFVAQSQITPYKMVRQALMELEVRYHSYNELKNNLRKAEIMRKRLIQQRDALVDPLDVEMVQIDLDKADYDITIYKRKFKQSEREIHSFIDVIKKYAPDEESLQKFLVDDPVEERNYWIARMGKQAAMDIIAYGRVGSGNMDSIAMMDEDGQLLALRTAIEYSGLVQAGLSKISMDVQGSVDKYLKNDGMNIAQVYDETQKNLQLTAQPKTNGESI